MERLLARLERKLGRFAIEKLTTFIVGGMLMVFVLMRIQPNFVELLELDPHVALRQPWRFITYLFIPPTTSLIWILFSAYFTWLIGTNLENEWGAFKFNVYYLVGALGTTAAAWVTQQPQGNFWLNSSLFFAFATVFPNYQILVFFVLPVRIKWLALLSAVLILFEFVTGGVGTKVAIVVAFANYLLFFSGHLVALAKSRKVQTTQAMRRSSFRPPPVEQATDRACAICGKRETDGADIRVCSCEKCGSPRELCLEHARNH